jgi:hypothetical protein
MGSTYVCTKICSFFVDLLDVLACLHVIRFASAYLIFILVIKLSCELHDNKRYFIAWRLFLAKQTTKKIHKTW